MAPRPPRLEPPKGRPLGTNLAFKVAVGLIRPILSLITKPDWHGAEKLPKSGGAIVVCNHISYLDPLSFAHFLYNNGRAPRYLGKESIFRIPFIGRFVLAAGQIPVSRESKDAIESYRYAISALQAGHLIGIYPEATLTRDPGLWPMKGKTGAARLAITTGVPLYPCASWGPERVIPPYGRTIHFFPRTRLTVVMGDPVDLSNWRGQVDDPIAMQEATDAIMDAITKLLESIRGESAPTERFDPKKSDLPRTGNFRKGKK